LLSGLRNSDVRQRAKERKKKKDERNKSTITWSFICLRTLVFIEVTRVSQNSPQPKKKGKKKVIRTICCKLQSHRCDFTLVLPEKKKGRREH